MSTDLQPGVIAVRLADEGVPTRCIARAVAIPSHQLYEILVKARIDGRLLALPRDDWPPGCPRDQRSLQLSRQVTENHDTLMLAIQEVFDLTPLPARLMLMLVQYEQVPHARVDVEHKSFGVHVCKMRRQLFRHGIEIETLWGYGYKLSPEHRRKAMEMILAVVSPPPAISEQDR